MFVKLKPEYRMVEQKVVLAWAILSSSQNGEKMIEKTCFCFAHDGCTVSINDFVVIH